VPSSTSNSNERLPQGPWGKTWVVAGLITLVVCGGYEVFLRARGHRPSLNDDAGLWVSTRATIRPDDHAEVVAIGSSRVQLGLHLDSFAKAFGRKPVQLAVDGSSCVPTLRDLANDPHFCGTVLMDVTPWAFFNGVLSTDGTAAEYVRTYHHDSPASAVERRLRAVVQQTLSIDLPGARPGAENVLAWMRARSFPQPQYWEIGPDRSKSADY